MQLEVLTRDSEEETREAEPELEVEQAPSPPDLSKARSFLTDLRPSGFGELLVTDAWLPPEPKPLAKEEPPVDRQRAWKQRQEWRELNLLRERPAVSYDARTEDYWGQVSAALARCPEAIVDAYTHLVAGFADAGHDRMAEYSRDAREYGREGDALLNLGRAQLAIGRLKSARNVIKAAAKAEPSHARVWYHLGVAGLFARANAEASDAFRRALDQMPGDLRTEAGLGVARYHERKYAEAEEHFRRTAGSGGLRAACRSMLACSMRMQQKWDEARVELGFLRNSGSERWATVAQQCLDCVERGEQRYAAPFVSRRKTREAVKSVATAGGGAVAFVYVILENVLKQVTKGQKGWVIAGALVALGLLVRLVGRSGRRGQSEPVGNYEQGLPCWQTTTWMRPRRSEF